jgi:hypothetical protein
MTDNTTGVVGLMELARVIHQHAGPMRLGVRIAWWAGHEMPYNGSTWYLDNHWDELRENCVAVINADSWAIGESDGNVEVWAFAELEEAARSWAADVVGTAVTAGDFDAKEAEQSFWAIGIPSAMAFSVNPVYAQQEGMAYLGPWFHTEYDTIDKVGIRALAELVRIYAVAVLRMAPSGPRSLRYSQTASKLGALLRSMALTAPPTLGLAQLATNAEQLERVCAELEAAAPTERREEATMRLGRIVNPVLYTVAGRYGQDPSSATYLRNRLPALQRALDAIAATPDEASDLRNARMTTAIRERNRVADALREAELLVRDVIDT